MKEQGLPHSTKKFEKRAVDFFAWLRERGSDVRATSNKYEVARFTTPEGVGVIYRNRGDMISSWIGGAEDAYNAFLQNSEWRAQAATKRKARTGGRLAHIIQTLIERDGNECWYCGDPFSDQGAKRRTREHLVSITQGGPDNVANQVLAHQDCNNDAGNLSVAEKVRLRDQKRTARFDRLAAA